MLVLYIAHVSFAVGVSFASVLGLNCVLPAGRLGCKEEILPRECRTIKGTTTSITYSRPGIPTMQTIWFGRPFPPARPPVEQNCAQALRPLGRNKYHCPKGAGTLDQHRNNFTYKIATMVNFGFVMKGFLRHS